MNKAINLSGKMSILGVTKLSGNVIRAFIQASQEFYFIKTLRGEVEEKISLKFDAEEAFISSSATAGIVHTILVLKKKLLGIEQERKIRVLLPVGHHINYGAPIKKIIEMTGAIVIPIGNANELNINDLSESLNEKADLAFYVSSHHASQKNHLSAGEFVKFYEKHKVSTAIDIAAEEDIWKFLKMKYTFTIVSGSKAISGPTSGIVFTNKANKILLEQTLHEEGRAMKIGKENIMGLAAAVDEYSKVPKITIEEQQIEKYIQLINKNTIFKASVNEDLKRGIKRILLSSTKNNIEKLLTIFRKNDVYVREYLKLNGEIELDLRQTTNEEVLFVIEIIRGIND